MKRPDISLGWDPTLSDLATDALQKLEGPAPMTAVGVYREPEFSKEKGCFHLVVDYGADRRSAKLGDTEASALNVLGSPSSLRTLLRLSPPVPDIDPPTVLGPRAEDPED
jgi:hypothetical protein